MCLYLQLYFTNCKDASQKFYFGQESSNQYIFLLFPPIGQCPPFSSCQKEKWKKNNEEQGKEKMGDLPTNFFFLCTWILSIMSLKTLSVTTCSQNSPCKVSNIWPFKRQLFFSSHFLLNSQVHVQTTATEEQFQVACKHGVSAVHFCCF